MDKDVKYAYRSPSDWYSWYVDDDQWVEKVPEEKEFNLWHDFKQDYVELGNSKFYYVGAFRGEVKNRIKHREK